MDIKLSSASQGLKKKNNRETDHMVIIHFLFKRIVYLKSGPKINSSS